MQNRVSQLENHVPDSGNTGNGGSGETGDDYADQIAAMQKELADLKSAVQSSRDMYSKLESNMEGLQEMLYQHDSNLNEVRDRLESYEAFMAEFNDFKAWVQQELDIIKADIEDIKSSLLELITADADLNALISALNSCVEQLEAEITALKNGESGGNGGTVTPPDDSQVENLEVRIAALEQDLQAKDLQIDAAIASLNASMEADLAEQLAQIEGLSESLQQHIQTATTTFATQEALSGLSAEIEQLKTDYEARFNLIESTVAFTVITAGLYGLGSGSIEIVCCRRADSLRTFISWSLALPVESHWMRAWMIDESGRTIMTVSRMVSVTDSVFSVTSVV